jgi:signal transduction histidine kinase
MYNIQGRKRLHLYEISNSTYSRQAKITKMNPSIISRPVARLSNFPHPDNLYRNLLIPKSVPKKSEQYAAALAHEVRNPLSNINLAVEMLKSTYREEDQHTYLDVIIRSSARINDLVSQFLEANHAEEINSDKHSIHQLLDEVLEMNDDRIMLKNITVRKDYSTLDCKIMVDKPKMRIALTNIIINALDAMPSGTGKLKLVTKSINGRCIIEIEDNGIGISEKNLKSIFEPYFTKKVGGMGIGLSTTLDILISNGAIVDVQSELGRGTRFILSFDGIKQCGNCLSDKPGSPGLIAQ